MSKKAKLNRTAHANFRLTLDVGVELGALSIEDAIVKARAFKVEDLFDFAGMDHNDSSIEVDGVFLVR